MLLLNIHKTARHLSRVLGRIGSKNACGRFGEEFVSSSLAVSSSLSGEFQPAAMGNKLDFKTIIRCTEKITEIKKLLIKLLDKCYTSNTEITNHYSSSFIFHL